MASKLLYFAVLSVALLYLICYAEFTPVRAVYEQY